MFHPISFVLPEELNAWQSAASRCREQHWIVKPANSGGGEDIRVVPHGAVASEVVRMQDVEQQSSFVAQGPLILTPSPPWLSWPCPQCILCPPVFPSPPLCAPVAEYIMHPLLVGGRKFDMRLYVVVTSFGDCDVPPEVYLFREGFVRLICVNIGSLLSP